jgi:hypothetical protein
MSVFLSPERHRPRRRPPAGGRGKSRRNPGLVLGAVMAEAARAGRDKLTVLADTPLVTFGSWLEQLIAESSGKDGRMFR